MTRNAITKLNDNIRVQIEKEMIVEVFWIAIKSMVDIFSSEITTEKVRSHFRNGSNAFALNMMNEKGLICPSNLS